MREVVIVEAARTPIGKRGGGLSTCHSAELLGSTQAEVLTRAGMPPSEVGQVIGGCISQVGMQGYNVSRTAWLTAGLPEHVPASTVDSQCGSSQHAFNLGAALIAGGGESAVLACGVELMSQVPLGAAQVPGLGKVITREYWRHREYTTQFEGAERIAEKWGITRADADEFGLRSQVLAARAWDEGRFDAQIIPVDAPVADDAGKPTGAHHRVERDEGLRATSLEGLAQLRPVARPDGIHTAGTSSQISDAAAAVLLMSRDRASELGLRPRARVIGTCLVGADPVLMLTGPIAATKRLLGDCGMAIGDVDLFENNEAFASVVLAWQRELQPDPGRVNVNGGAIALGHALGSTGTVLITKAIHELERVDGEVAMVTMCCGGGLATGTVIQRI